MGSRTMGIRSALSSLTTAEARRAAARGLLVLCALGYLITLFVLFARGGELRSWLFTLLIWTLFVYLPLRIVLEAFQSIAPTIRRGLVAETVGRADRYATRSSIILLVEALLQREVVMPRIATPLQRIKSHDGAVAILSHLGRDDSDRHRDATIRCLALIDRWIIELAASARSPAPPPIQTRWADLRALIALAAVGKVLLAAYADRTDTPLRIPTLGDRDPGDYLDTCLDFSDELALEVDPIPWTEPSLALSVDSATFEHLRRTWSAFASTEPPALEARMAFLNELFSETDGVRSARSTVG